MPNHSSCFLILHVLRGVSAGLYHAKPLLILHHSIYTERGHINIYSLGHINIYSLGITGV